MYIQRRSQGDSSNEEEERIERVGRQHEERRNGKVLVDGGGYQVNERQHGEDSDEHDVVDGRGVSLCRIMYHVTGQGQDEKSPEELSGR